MKSNNHLNATLERILRFDFTKDDIASRANAALFREYLRRSVLWSDATGCKMSKFDDHASCIDRSVRAPDDAVEQVRQHIVVWGKNAPVQIMCVYALHWAALKDTMDLEETYGLPDPYEPLLVLFDRGRDFYMENGVCFVGTFPFSLFKKEYYRNMKPLLSLDEDTLNAIDQAK